MLIFERKRIVHGEEVTDWTTFVELVTETVNLAISEQEEIKTVTPRLARIVIKVNFAV